jgi:dolichol-phosphate mannosyltransferase
LINLAERIDFVTVIDLSRNFGQHTAIACGLQHASGEIVFLMNVDLQDSPKEMPRMIKEIRENDLDLVVGQYPQRQSPLVNKVSAHLYYSFFNLMTGIKVEQNTSAMRAMSRRFVDSHNLIQEKSHFPQGLDHWLGYRHKYIEIEHHARVDDKSSYNIASRLRLAIDGILYFSDRPLKLIASFGFLLSFLGFAMAFWTVIEKIVGTELLPGFASLMSVLLIAFGVNITILGLIGLYVGKIFQEVKNRPQFLIRNIYGATIDQT